MPTRSRPDVPRRGSRGLTNRGLRVQFPPLAMQKSLPGSLASMQPCHVHAVELDRALRVAATCWYLAKFLEREEISSLLRRPVRLHAGVVSTPQTHPEVPPMQPSTRTRPRRP